MDRAQLIALATLGAAVAYAMRGVDSTTSSAGTTSFIARSASPAARADFEAIAKQIEDAFGVWAKAPAVVPNKGRTVSIPGADPAYAKLRALIVRAEARGNYNAYWGGIARADAPPRPLTSMTIGQVLDWQDSIDLRYQSEAAGGPQFLEDTLRRIYARAGLTLADLFSKEAQDLMCDILINDAGGRAWKARTITAEQFGDKLARVWAGLPVHSRQRGRFRIVEAGQSYYAGDGLNKATIAPAAVIDALT